MAVQVGLGKVRDRGSSFTVSMAETVVVDEERRAKTDGGRLASVVDGALVLRFCCSSSSDGGAEKMVEIVEIESLWLCEKGPEDVEEGVVGGESMAAEDSGEQLGADGLVGDVGGVGSSILGCFEVIWRFLECFVAEWICLLDLVGWVVLLCFEIVRL